LWNLAALHRRHPLPTGSARDGVAIHRLATPRGQDELGIPADDFVGRHDALARARTVPQLDKDIAASGDLDELRDPADAGDERIVPLLEVDTRAMGPHARVLADLLHLVPDVLDEAARGLFATERAADHEHGAQHVFERALVRAQHGDAAADQLPHDVLLEIGEPQHEIGLELEDLVDPERREAADLDLLSNRVGPPRGAGDPDHAS